MRINRRRAVTTPRGRGGAAARPRPDDVTRADWRSIVAQGAAPQAPQAPQATPSPEATPPPQPRHEASTARRRSARAVTMVAVGLGLTLFVQGVALLTPTDARDAEAMAGTLTSSDGPPAAAVDVRVATPPARRAAPPVAVSIGRIGVRSSLVGLGVRRDRTIDTPKNYGQAGWYRDGSRPGEAGPTVIVGHVDSTDGPAVFFRLRELTRGDRVEVRRKDGVVVTYVVSEIRRVAKSRFPTKDVYGATPRSALRLVTCGGAFDTKSRSYRDNLVVFADALVTPALGGTS